MFEDIVKENVYNRTGRLGPTRKYGYVLVKKGHDLGKHNKWNQALIN